MRLISSGATNLLAFAACAFMVHEIPSVFLIGQYPFTRWMADRVLDRFNWWQIRSNARSA